MQNSLLDGREEIPFLLDYRDQDPLPNDWHRYYGITQKRSHALLASQSNKNSFRNPLSETALTLFMLGQLDGWKQISTLVETPRDAGDGWNKRLFSGMRASIDMLSRSRLLKAQWGTANCVPFTNRDFSNAVLVFEFEVFNCNFNDCKSDAGRPFRRLSFLDLRAGRGSPWSQYDAVLILPPERSDAYGTIIGFESKLSSDCSLRTLEFAHVNQIVRNLEAGYWITHDRDSQYDGWDYYYVFLCPQDTVHYQSTFYGYALKDDNSRSELLKNYGRLLRDNKHKVRPNVFDEHFGPFCEWAKERITILYWKDLAKIMTTSEPDYFEKYVERLATVDRGMGLVDAAITRFRAAGIPVKYEA